MVADNKKAEPDPRNTKDKGKINIKKVRTGLSVFPLADSPFTSQPASCRSAE
jgi:hypothetical protein